jgi:hypothetical protein
MTAGAISEPNGGGSTSQYPVGLHDLLLEQLSFTYTKTLAMAKAGS